MSFMSSLKESREKAQATKDPWHLRLEGLRGKKWDDDIERISTQTVFEILEVPQRSRTAGACRRLATLMRELGWDAHQDARPDPGRLPRPGAGLCAGQAGFYFILISPTYSNADPAHHHTIAPFKSYL